MLFPVGWKEEKENHTSTSSKKEDGRTHSLVADVLMRVAVSIVPFG